MKKSMDEIWENDARNLIEYSENNIKLKDREMRKFIESIMVSYNHVLSGLIQHKSNMKDAMEDVPVRSDWKNIEKFALLQRQVMNLEERMKVMMAIKDLMM